MCESSKSTSYASSAYAAFKARLRPERGCQALHIRLYINISIKTTDNSNRYHYNEHVRAADNDDFDSDTADVSSDA